MRHQVRVQVVYDLRVGMGRVLAVVEPARLEELGVVEPWYRARDLVAEVGIRLEGDRSFGDALHARRRVRDLDLLRAVVAVASADAAGVEQVRLDRMRGEQLEQPIALQTMGEREERVRARDAEELPLLCDAAGRGARRLTEHEVGGPLLLGELGDRGER